jgi:hypothetical protein
MLDSKQSTNQKTVVKIWMTGKNYPTTIIPKEFARPFNLDKPGFAILEMTSTGLLLQKINL